MYLHSLLRRDGSLSLDMDGGKTLSSLLVYSDLTREENGRQKGGNTWISAKLATKLEYTRHVVNMFKHDNNHNVSIIPEDEAPYRPLQVYEAAFIVHCNIITSGTDINMINRIDQIHCNIYVFQTLSHEIFT